jgi:hypothetical protein
VGPLGRLLWAHDSHDLNWEGHDNHVLWWLKDTQTAVSALIKQAKRPADGLRPRTQDREAISSPPPTKKSRTTSRTGRFRQPSVRNRGRSELVLAKGIHSERPWRADQPSLLIVGMTEK